MFGNIGNEQEPSRLLRAEAISHDASGVRILLAEDNMLNQQVATEFLENAGATVTVANHGGEAVRILTEAEQPPPFGIMFMELQMPEMDGFTAARLLRAQPQLQGRPIIAMTAHVLVEERQRCVGLFPTETYSVAEAPVQPGDKAVLYTDAVLEIGSPSEQEFGMDLFEGFLESNHNLTADKFADSLLAELSDWLEHPKGNGQEDDITPLAIDFQSVR
jgi:CheY-like chemotaxis protein